MRPGAGSGSGAGPGKTSRDSTIRAIALYAKLWVRQPQLPLSVSSYEKVSIDQVPSPDRPPGPEPAPEPAPGF